MNRVNAFQKGATLIEVLIAVLVTLIGILGMVALQMRAFGAESESYQRAHAAILLQDMVNRINANYVGAAGYVANDIGVGALQACAGPGTPTYDLCEWGNLIRGVAEASGGTRVGAMTAARGCIVSAGPNLYVISVAWQGTVPSAAPSAACGAGQYSSEDQRRVLSTVVRIPDLTT